MEGDHSRLDASCQRCNRNVTLTDVDKLTEHQQRHGDSGAQQSTPARTRPLRFVLARVPAYVNPCTNARTMRKAACAQALPVAKLISSHDRACSAAEPSVGELCRCAISGGSATASAPKPRNKLPEPDDDIRPRHHADTRGPSTVRKVSGPCRKRAATASCGCGGSCACV